ncbi:MAG: tetrahydrofolate dehydrogenase/cyclohydrolase catalytic domain-containing protein [Actinomycetota bacterium]
MSAELLDGAKLAGRMNMESADRIGRLLSAGRTVGLGTILIGDNPSSAKYVAMKHADCAELGINSFHEHLAESVSQREVEEVIDRMNTNPEIHGILVQLPLPEGMNQEEVLLRISPDKDVDGLHPLNLGKLVMGQPGPLPCTPAGIVELLLAHRVPVEGQHVVIIGRGLTVGRPLALLLALPRRGCNAAVSVVHRGVENFSEIVRSGDVVVSAAGSPSLVVPAMIKPGAAVVGAGTSFVNGKLLSDIADGVENLAGWITPRIGGVGPMTRAMLVRNTVLAAEKVR